MDEDLGVPQDGGEDDHGESGGLSGCRDHHIRVFWQENGSEKVFFGLIFV